MEIIDSSKRRIKSAFTLIEILVVMSVVMIVLSFGVVGVTRIQQSIELQNGYSDIVTFLKTVQNAAINSKISSTGSAPDIYAVRFTTDDNQYSRLNCNEGSTTLNCSAIQSEDQDLKPENLDSITYSFDFTGTGDCTTIGFEKRSGKVYAFDTSNILRTSGICTISVAHSSRPGSTKELILNIDNNNIDVED